MKTLESAVRESIDYNPLFLAYCKKCGRTPEAQLEHDDKDFPGGRMTGFICWISVVKQEFWKQHPEAWLDRYSIGDYDAWKNFVLNF